MNRPLVSVLMTAYNRQDFIGEAIESVLSSTYENFELIIVDDCSTDKTVDIVNDNAANDQRIKLFKNEQNLGDYPNRNKAASWAKGKYIKYLDSDDIMYSHCLQVMVESMEKFPEAGFGLCAKPDENTPYPSLLSPKETYLEHFNGFGHFNRAPGSAIIKKEVFDKENGFSGERMIGDNELWFRLGRKYPMVKIVSGLYWDRLHAGQERQSSYAQKHYAMLSKNVLLNAFEHVECPFTIEEKQLYLNKMRKNSKRNFVKSILRIW